MTSPTDPTPWLRREPDPKPTSGRKVLIGVAVFFVLLVGFVLTLVFTVGINNNGVKSSSLPAASATPAVPATLRMLPFFAIDAKTGAINYVTARTTAVPYRTGGSHQRAVTIGVASAGRTAYYAVPKAGCRTTIYAVYAGGVIRTAPIGTMSGRALDVPIAVSPDGTKLAVVASEAAGSSCGPSAAAFVYDLRTDRARLVRPVKAGAPVSLAWEPGGRSLDVLTGGKVWRQFVACRACVAFLVGPVGDSQALLWWHRRLAAVTTEGTVRTVGSAGLGATLLRGLPTSVASASVDPSGTRLLVWGGLQTVAEPGDIRFRTTYAWSGGRSTNVPGQWIDPAW